MRCPLLLASFGAEAVLYVISTNWAGTVDTVWFVCGFVRLTVVSVLFTI
jgi:hypothetical protein